jgi:putative phosphoribosyl transferase
MKKFHHRTQAGQLLAERLMVYQNKPHTLVLALPRGGVPVAFEIAQKLQLPLDIYLVRKLGVPGQEELAMGAIANNDVIVFNSDILDSLSLTTNQIDAVITSERHELTRRNKLYRHEALPPLITHQTIILVDDGLATGATMRAAISALKKSQPAKIIVAVPVGSPDICIEIRKEVDELVCLSTPEPFYSVGTWYEDFPQTSDNEVLELLQRARI